MVDIQLLVEPLLYGHGIAGDPDLQFRIEIEVPSSLNAKMGDVSVRQRVILDLIPRKALLVHQDEPLVRKNEQVPDKLVRLLNTLF